MSNNVNSNLEVLFNKMENFISTKTVVGEPVTFGDVIVLPLVDVQFFVGAGGGGADGESEKKAGGSGGGLGSKITPSAVLVVTGGNVQLVNIKHQDSLNKLIDMVPGILSKFNLGDMFNKKEEPSFDFDAEHVKTDDAVTE